MAQIQSSRLDWDELRFFLAVARHGTLSAAARALAVTQPTVSRRLAAFQERIGTHLLRGTRGGYVLTAAGREIVEYVVQIEERALRVERLAVGRDAGVSGHVRVTTTRWFADAVLSSVLSPLVAEHPGLQLELVGSPSWANVSAREADIAVRFTRFEQEGVVQRRIARVGFGLYAAPAYLRARGAPDFERGCTGHQLIGMNEEAAMAADHDYLRTVAPNACVVFRSNSREGQARAAASGAGIVCIPHHLAAHTPGLTPLRPRLAAPDRTVWLGFHREMRKLPRVRVVAEAIANGVKQLHGALDPSTER